MKTKNNFIKTQHLFLLAGILLFFGCNDVNTKETDDVKNFLLSWSNKHTNIKYSYLKQDYFDEVEYYGADLLRPQVMADKMNLFEKFPDFRQKINEDKISIEKEGSEYLVSYIREISYNGKTAEYPSFISVFYKNGDFRIIREGVKTSEKPENLNPDIFPTKASLESVYNEKSKLYGDFNGDGLAEYMWIENPMIEKASVQTDSVICKGGCKSVIKFSNKDINSITILDAYKTDFENLKDLNGDGSDELGIWNIKGNSKSLYIYNPLTGELVTEPIVINTDIHKNLKLIDVIKKVGPKKIRVSESLQKDGNWILTSRVITLQ